MHARLRCCTSRDADAAVTAAVVFFRLTLLFFCDFVFVFDFDFDFAVCAFISFACRRRVAALGGYTLSSIPAYACHRRPRPADDATADAFTSETPSTLPLPPTPLPLPLLL
jgi:hypothetical protein